MASLAPAVISLLVSAVTGASLLLGDRAYLARRTDPYGRCRMWNRATLWLAVSGLFVPVPFAFAAHIWVTRRGGLVVRAAMAIGAGCLAAALWLGLAWLALWLLGVPLDEA